MIKINIRSLWLVCLLLMGVPNLNHAVTISTIRKLFDNILPQVLCNIFDDEEACQSRRTGNIGSISDEAMALINQAKRRSCTPYDDCTGESKIAPINLCIAIQKSCTLNFNEVKWAYEHAKELIKTIDNAGFISTLVYSDQGELQDKLKRLPKTKLKSMKKAFKKFKPSKKAECEDCMANTKDAIKTCWNEFNKINNSLQDVMIIYCDGVSFDTRFNLAQERQNTFQHAQENSARNIQTFVIKYKNPNGPIKGDFEWNALNNPGPLESRHPDPFPINKNLKAKTFLNDVCKVIPDCTPKPPQCGEIDLVLVVDRSNSIVVADIKRTIKFLRSMVQNLQVDAAHIRIGIITYNQIVYVHADVNDALSKEDVLARIAGIPTINNLATHTNEALEKARVMLKSSSRKGYAKQVIVVATDGQTWLLKANAGGYAAKHNSPVTVEQARLAKEEGVTIFTIGLPNKGNATSGREKEWIPSSSKPFECHFIDMTEPGVTFDDLVLARFHILTQLCIFDDKECQYVTDEEEEELAGRSGVNIEGSGE